MLMVPCFIEKFSFYACHGRLIYFVSIIQDTDCLQFMCSTETKLKVFTATLLCTADVAQIMCMFYIQEFIFIIYK